MLRLLVIILIIAAVISLLHRLISSKQSSNKAQELPVKMVKCAYCQVHITEEEAIYSNGLSFCSPDHKQLAMINKDE